MLHKQLQNTITGRRASRLLFTQLKKGTQDKGFNLKSLAKAQLIHSPAKLQGRG